VFLLALALFCAALWRCAGGGVSACAGAHRLYDDAGCRRDQVERFYGIFVPTHTCSMFTYLQYVSRAYEHIPAIYVQLIYPSILQVALPAFLTIALMPLSHSISNGIWFGLPASVLLRLLTHPLLGRCCGGRAQGVDQGRLLLDDDQQRRLLDDDDDSSA